MGDKTKWRNEMYVTVYELCRSGITSQRAIAKAIGVSHNVFLKWLGRNPALRDAFDRGKEALEGSPFDFKEYIFGQLPPSLQTIWSKMENFDTDTSEGVLEVERLLGKGGKAMRQRMFLHAWVSSLFNQSEACRKTNTPLSTLKKWIREDAEFVELFNEIQEHKKNFLENCLLGLCQRGNPAAIIHANKTVNADRGYKEKREVEVSGMIQHNHTHISLGTLDLDLETRKTILAAARNKRLEVVDFVPLESGRLSKQLAVAVADDEDGDRVW